jgi:hypothetical protein
MRQTFRMAIEFVKIAGAFWEQVHHFVNDFYEPNCITTIVLLLRRTLVRSVSLINKVASLTTGFSSSFIFKTHPGRFHYPPSSALPLQGWEVYKSAKFSTASCDQFFPFFFFLIR